MHCKKKLYCDALRKVTCWDNHNSLRGLYDDIVFLPYSHQKSLEGLAQVIGWRMFFSFQVRM
ncbi:MAG: hypothetical protein ACI9GO_000112 [Bacteroidia bacterium]|jgi:hypothetical protein